jgi:hypothetical protein
VFRAKWILLLEIQEKCKKWVWKEKSVDCQNYKFSTLTMWKKKRGVHTWANCIGYTILMMRALQWGAQHHFFFQLVEVGLHLNYCNVDMLLLAILH